MRRLLVLAAACFLLAVLGIAQLVLPGIAAQRLRDRLAGLGQVQSVQVSAFPAITLLWHAADSVRVQMASFQASVGQLQGLLEESGQAARLDATVTQLRAGLLTVRHATLRKRGSSLTATAQVQSADLSAAVPFITNVQPVSTGGGTLTLRGTASLLGLVNATVDATVGAVDGALLVSAPPVTLTVFSDPRVAIESVTASPAAGGFTVTAEATFR